MAKSETRPSLQSIGIGSRPKLCQQRCPQIPAIGFQNDLMQTKLREKLNNVRSLEKKVLALLMPIKAKNSMDDQTIDNIERIVFQINEQILDHSVGIDDLATQMGELDIEGDKKVDVLSNCSKLKLRQKLRQKSIMF